MAPLFIALSSTLLLMGAPEPPDCIEVQSPFADADRRAFDSVKARVRSSFGAHRSSFIKGHKHAGVDLKALPAEAIFAMCPGVVVDIHLGFPHRTVVVRHTEPGGEVWFSSSKHLTEIEVEVGDVVDGDRQLGRAFTRAEQRRAGWMLIHLHLEVRRSISDGGEASWSSMSMKELRRWARDPELFLKDRMRGGT